MNSFTLGVADLRTATGWGAHRARMIIKRPYSLECQLESSGPKGGGKIRKYRLSDFLARCRTKRAFTEEMAHQLIAADAAYRTGRK